MQPSQVLVRFDNDLIMVHSHVIYWLNHKVINHKNHRLTSKLSSSPKNRGHKQWEMYAREFILNLLQIYVIIALERLNKCLATNSIVIMHTKRVSAVKISHSILQTVSDSYAISTISVFPGNGLLLYKHLIAYSQIPCE